MAHIQTGFAKHLQKQSRLERFLEQVKAIAAEWTNRRHLRSLDAVREHHLKDIGLTRFDVQSASSQPLSADAATALYILANERKGSW